MKWFLTRTPHSAKHLHSSEEKLTSLAGSFGYVAPEVLNNKGHGKPVDLWSIGYARHLASPDAPAKISHRQYHHLRPSLRLLPLPLRRHERARTPNDRSQNHLPRPLLEQRLRRRYASLPFPCALPYLTPPPNSERLH